MSKLVLFLPDGTSLDVPLNRERMTIGRRADNEICLPNLAVSGEHAVVVTILDDSFLEDLRSTNGTLVNGKAIAKHFLRDRDQIEIGRHKLVYCADDAAVLEPEVVRGMARVSVRDWGDVVEPAKPFVRGRSEPAPMAVLPDEVALARQPAAGAQTASAIAAADATLPPTPAPLRQPQPGPSIKVLSGINAGAAVPLIKAETTIGRPGVQVAAIVKTGSSFVLKRIEGARAPAVNDQPVAADGRELVHGDVIEVAGTRLEFVAPADARPASSAQGETADLKGGL